MIDTIQKAALAAELADEKKATEINTLDLRGLCNFADVFMVCTGNNNVQIHAICDAVTVGLKKLGFRKPIVDNERGNNWSVLDFGDLVVHVMTPEARSFYRLENLWGDAQEIAWPTVLEEYRSTVGSAG